MDKEFLGLQADISKFVFNQARLKTCAAEGCKAATVDGLYCEVHLKEIKEAMDEWEHERAKQEYKKRKYPGELF